MKNYGNCIKTDNNNYYYFSAYKNETILLNKILYLIIQEFLVKKSYFNQNSAFKNINKIEKIQKKDFNYYYNKFIFLKEGHYFDEIDTKKLINGRLVGKEIKKFISNTKSLTFEVTENCNLNCNYCTYGNFYNKKENRGKKNLETKKAYLLIDYMINLWNSYSCLNLDYDKRIGFYGGEPLLNFELIKKILSYLKNKGKNKYNIIPIMTTNGILLDKYMDFIVENNFELCISLDGDKNNNGHRLFHNGTSSFEKVFQNIITLKNKYPLYFETKVKFNAVLHNKNSISDINSFFSKNFNTQALISELSTCGLSIENENLFWETYKNSFQSFNEVSKCSLIEPDDINSPSKSILEKFSISFCNIYYSNYYNLFLKKALSNYYPTGTCQPFSRKVFLTVQDKILLCEKISTKLDFGNISDDNVNINFENIAHNINTLYSIISKQCEFCYNINNCSECLFDLDKLYCKKVMNSITFNNYLKYCYTNIEKEPEIFNEIIENTNYE
jgi:uncharacterized protein